MLFELVRLVDKEKFLPTVGCLKGKGVIGERIEALGIKVKYFQVERFWNIIKLLKIISFFKKEKFDILHSYLFHANIIGRVFGRIAGIPIIISSIRVCEKGRRSHLWMDRITNWMVDIEICVSKEVKNFTIEKAGIPEHKLKIVENGITDSFLDAVTSCRNKKEEIKGKLGLDNSLIVGTIARLSRQKGIEYLIKTVKIVISKFPDITFIIAGKKLCREKLVDLSIELGISDKVKFLGFIKDIPKLLSVIDIFVLPSLWEGMPNVVLEAMAAEKPVIATDTGGSKDIIDNNINGVLVEPKNSEALAEAILKLLKNPDERERLGKAAEQRVKEKFPIDRMVSKTEQIYTQLLTVTPK